MIKNQSFDASWNGTRSQRIRIFILNAGTFHATHASFCLRSNTFLFCFCWCHKKYLGSKRRPTTSPATAKSPNPKLNCQLSLYQILTILQRRWRHLQYLVQLIIVVRWRLTLGAMVVLSWLVDNCLVDIWMIGQRGSHAGSDGLRSEWWWEGGGCGRWDGTER